jgi:hypothetical protein
VRDRMNQSVPILHRTVGGSIHEIR